MCNGEIGYNDCFAAPVAVAAPDIVVSLPTVVDVIVERDLALVADICTDLGINIHVILISLCKSPLSPSSRKEC